MHKILVAEDRKTGEYEEIIEMVYNEDFGIIFTIKRNDGSTYDCTLDGIYENHCVICLAYVYENGNLGSRRYDTYAWSEL